MAMRASVRLTFGGETQRLSQTFQGSIDESGTFTGNGGGRGAKPLTIPDAWGNVVEIFDDPAQNNGTAREVHIGPDAKFHVGNAFLHSEGNQIIMEQPGFNGQTERNVIQPSNVIGGIMAPTTFHASEEAGIRIK